MKIAAHTVIRIKEFPNLRSLGGNFLKKPHFTDVVDPKFASYDNPQMAKIRRTSNMRSISSELSSAYIYSSRFSLTPTDSVDDHASPK
jgi:hypothetical protein